MQVSIIIVSYNVKYFLEQCLRSVLQSTQHLQCEIIVVDNHSVDESAEMIATKFPSVHLIRNTQNFGFSAANNQAIKIAKGKFILLLNPDTIIAEDTISNVLEFMQSHEDAGAVGVQMVDGRGKFLNESKRGIPNFRTSLFKFLGLHKIFPNSPTFNHYYLGHLDKEKTHEVDVLVGAFMMIRSSVVEKVGILDEQFFMYWEDTDWCIRIRNSGYKIYYLGNEKIIHYKGESNKRHTLNFTLEFNRSMISFVKKHFQSHPLFLPLIRVATICKLLYVVLRDTTRLLFLPLMDFSIMYLTVLIFTKYWEQNFTSFPFPDIFFNIVVPAYLFVWITSLFFAGAYDSPFRINKVARGVIFGLLVIATISNFFNAIRFSRMIIGFSSIFVFIDFVVLRFLYRFIQFHDWDIAEKRPSNLVLIAEQKEYKRAKQIITNSKHNTLLIGFLNLNGNENAINKVSNMQMVIQKYHVDEIVFASANFSFKEIIQWHILHSDTSLKFKILPEESHFLIGSNSRETLGDYYCPDSNWELNKTYHRRNKRVIDLFFSFLFLLISPILIWLCKSPSTFLRNMINILKGNLTFVGFNKKYESHFPNIRKGILTPVSTIHYEYLSTDRIRKVNMLYAKNYRARWDIYIIFKCINQLG